MTERKPQDQDKFIVRLPDGMRDRIKDAAEANRRSMNAEIVAAIESHLDRPRFAFDPGPPTDDLHPDDDLGAVPPDLSPQVRAAMDKVIEQIADDARRRLNEWLWQDK